MSIQQFYRAAANTSLNGSLAALFSACLFIVPLLILLPGKELIMFFMPFLMYSFFSYLSYLLYARRYLEIGSYSFEAKSPTKVLEHNQALLQFMPAPSLRMLFFSPDGILDGEIRDLYYKKYRWFLPYFIDKLFPAKYGLYDVDNQLVTSFIWNGKSTVDILDEIGNHVITVEQLASNSNSWSIRGRLIEAKVTSQPLFTDVQIIMEERGIIGRVRKGWMPLAWGKFFKDANTPVLSIANGVSKEEKLLILAILIHLFRYHNH